MIQRWRWARTTFKLRKAGETPAVQTSEPVFSSSPPFFSPRIKHQSKKLKPRGDQIKEAKAKDRRKTHQIPPSFRNERRARHGGAGVWAAALASDGNPSRGGESLYKLANRCTPTKLRLFPNMPSPAEAGARVRPSCQCCGRLAAGLGLLVKEWPNWCTDKALIAHKSQFRISQARSILGHDGNGPKRFFCFD
jgi:hypothetical protein